MDVNVELFIHDFDKTNLLQIKRIKYHIKNNIFIITIVIQNFMNQNEIGD
jgi:hypothetical protein